MSEFFFKIEIIFAFLALAVETADNCIVQIAGPPHRTWSQIQIASINCTMQTPQ